MRIYIPPFVRVTEGNKQQVAGRWRTVVDLSALDPDERKAFEKGGKLAGSNRALSAVTRSVALSGRSKKGSGLSKAEELEIALGRVYVPPHVRVTESGKVNVEGYWRQSTGGTPASESPGANFQLNKAPKGPRPKGVKSGTGTKNDPWVTGDVNTAIELIGKDEYVRLEQPRQVSTLLDGLKKIADDAKSKGEKAPKYDLCKVSVPGTNLFCAESKGIPRIKMPQLGGTPEPGSPADKFPKNKEGEVDLSDEFKSYLEDIGVEVEEGQMDAKFLRASQNELNGAKVAGIRDAIHTGKFDTSRGTLFISKDDYVIDGHHRWAATVGEEYAEGKNLNINVRRIDMDILSVLALANDWSEKMGVKKASAAQSGVNDAKS